MAKKIAYTGVFLDEKNRAELLRWFEQTAGQPLLGKTHGSHMTIQIKPTDADLAALPLGQKATLRVVGWASDEKGRAVVVEPSVPSTKPIAHVTVATAADVPPVYSNDLLALGVTPADGPVLEGVIGTFPKLAMGRGRV